LHSLAVVTARPVDDLCVEVGGRKEPDRFFAANRSKTMSQPAIILKRLAALALWLTTIGLGIVDIYFVREIFFALYARVSREYRPAVLWGNIIVVLAALALVGFIVASTEYHRKRLCQHASWDLFTRTLVVELAIPFIAVFVV
jgi:hypothetical protein